MFDVYPWSHLNHYQKQLKRNKNLLEQNLMYSDVELE